MYRPNRIGPWPHWDSNQAIWEHGQATSATIGNTDIAKLFPQIESTVLADKAQFQLGVDTISMTGANTVAYGVPIAADFKVDNYQVSISGSCNFGATITQSTQSDFISLNAFLARPDSATLVVDEAAETNECSSFIWLPTLSTGPSMASVNTSVIVEDTLDNAKPLIAGWALRCFGSTFGIVVSANMSVEKYAIDTQVFDPNR